MKFRPHIVVATPGRLLHHWRNSKGFDLSCKLLTSTIVFIVKVYFSIEKKNLKKFFYFQKKTPNLSNKACRYLVLDEADRLLNLDFEDSVDEILRFLPKERNTFLFR